MSYTINETVKDLFLSGSRQLLRITLTTVDDEITITDSDVVEKSFKIDRCSILNNFIELGNVTASEVSFSLKNTNDKFNNVKFEGAEMFVEVGVTDGESDYYIPQGYFNIDNSPRYLSTIDITGLDRMVLFDKVIDLADSIFPISVSSLMTLICTKCNVLVSNSTPVSALTNSSYSVAKRPTSTDVTYRTLLSWCCQICGVNAFIDWQGKVCFRWYNSTPTETIAESDRYISGNSDILEKPLVITGIQVATEDNVYIGGTDEYALNIEGNELLINDISEVTGNLCDDLVGFSYTPFSCSILSYIWLYPMDSILYVKGDNSTYSILTNVNIAFNAGVAIVGKGETATSNGYAKNNPLTSQEKIIINTIAKDKVNEQIGTVTQETISLNEIISNSMGLYQTVVINSDNSKTMYYHSNPILANSVKGDTIYTMTANGFAFTKAGWNNGSPVWQYGVTDDANAILNTLTLAQLNADNITVGKLQSSDGSSYWDLDNGTYQFSAYATNEELLEKTSTYTEPPNHYLKHDVFAPGKNYFLSNGEVLYGGKLYVANKDNASYNSQFITSDGKTFKTSLGANFKTHNLIFDDWDLAVDIPTDTEISSKINLNTESLTATLKNGGLQSDVFFTAGNLDIYNANLRIFKESKSSDNEQVFGVSSNTGELQMSGRLGDFSSAVTGKIGSFELENNEGQIGTYSGFAIYNANKMAGSLYTTGDNLNYKSFGNFSLFNPTYQSVYLGSTLTRIQFSTDRYLAFTGSDARLNYSSSRYLVLNSDGVGLNYSSSRYLNMSSSTMYLRYSTDRYLAFTDSGVGLNYSSSRYLALNDSGIGLNYSSSRFLNMSSNQVVLQGTSNRYFYIGSGDAPTLSIAMVYNTSTSLMLTAGRCDIAANLYVNSVQVTSDRNKKRNIEQLQFSALEKLKNHKFYKYDIAHKDEKGKETLVSHSELGIMTDECATECVKKDENGEYIDLEAHIALLTKAIQELHEISKRGEKNEH